jgi:hypothetical protein
VFNNVFSRRKGYTPPPVQGKLEGLSNHTRDRLWDIFYVNIYRANQFDDLDGNPVLAPDLRLFLQTVWTELYHGRIDEHPSLGQFLVKLKKDFLQGLWCFPFDIFEAIFEFSENLMHAPDEIASQIRTALKPCRPKQARAPNPLRRISKSRPGRRRCTPRLLC